MRTERDWRRAERPGSRPTAPAIVGRDRIARANRARCPWPRRVPECNDAPQYSRSPVRGDHGAAGNRRQGRAALPPPARRRGDAARRRSPAAPADRCRRPAGAAGSAGCRARQRRHGRGDDRPAPPAPAEPAALALPHLRERRHRRRRHHLFQCPQGPPRAPAPRRPAPHRVGHHGDVRPHAPDGASGLRGRGSRACEHAGDPAGLSAHRGPDGTGAAPRHRRGRREGAAGARVARPGARRAGEMAELRRRAAHAPSPGRARRSFVARAGVVAARL